MAELLEWIRRVGGFVHPALEHKRLNKYNRGVVLREDVAAAPGALLFHIPPECCMNEATFAQLHPAVHARLEVPAERAGLLKHLRLVTFLHLEMERGDASPFAPYLAQLPRAADYAYHPVHQYRPEARDRWAKINAVATALIENHARTVDALAEELARLAAAEAPAVPALSREQCLWYYLVLLTRQWGAFGLVPFADNIQHSNRSALFLATVRAQPGSPTELPDAPAAVQEKKHSAPQETVQAAERPGFRVPAEGLRRGAQLFDNYGIGDEAITYTSFGFIDEPHSDDVPRYYRVNLNNTIAVANGLDSFKEAELRRVFGQTKAYYLCSDRLHPTVLGFLRLANLSAADFRALDPTAPYWQGIISLQNECAVHRQLLALIRGGGLVVPKDELDHAARALRRSKAGSVEWSLARLVAIRQHIVSRTVEMLVNSWMNLLQIPFKHTLALDLHAAPPAAPPTAPPAAPSAKSSNSSK